MAHFARITPENIVEQVIVISNDDAPDPFPQSEPLGQAYISDVLKLSGTWLQTSYTGTIRGKFAGIGDQWDPITETFQTYVATSTPLDEMTSEERDALTPQLGDMIHNSTTGDDEYWNGTTWEVIDAPNPHLEP